MSAEAVAHVFKNPTSHAACSFVWVAMADVANDQNDNLLWMSNASLVAKTGLAENTVRRALQKLVEMGCIEEVERRIGTTTKYRFLFATPARLGGDPQQDDGGNPPQDGTQTQEVTQENSSGRQDVIWDTLMEECAVSDPIPKSARGAYNKCVQQLKEMGVSPATIHQKALAYKKTWPNVSLTPTALLRRWAELPECNRQVDENVLELYPGSHLDTPVENLPGAQKLSQEDIERNQARIRELQEKFHAR